MFKIKFETYFFFTIFNFVFFLELSEKYKFSEFYLRDIFHIRRKEDESSKNSEVRTRNNR